MACCLLGSRTELFKLIQVQSVVATSLDNSGTERREKQKAGDSLGGLMGKSTLGTLVFTTNYSL